MRVVESDAVGENLIHHRGHVVDLKRNSQRVMPHASACSLPGTAPLVPKDSIAGRSLTAVVAIMTFLASLTTGVAMLVTIKKY